MLTRGPITQHAYSPYLPPPARTPGAIVERPAGAFNNKNNIVAAMPIARPNSSPSPDGAPFYLQESMADHAPMVRGGAMAITPSRPNLEMDPSDPTTWQRQYRFT
jgi:hypothetical protein